MLHLCVFYSQRANRQVDGSTTVAPEASCTSVVYEAKLEKPKKKNDLGGGQLTSKEGRNKAEGAGCGRQRGHAGHVIEGDEHEIEVDKDEQEEQDPSHTSGGHRENTANNEPGPDENGNGLVQRRKRLARDRVFVSSHDTRAGDENERIGDVEASHGREDSGTKLHTMSVSE